MAILLLAYVNMEIPAPGLLLMLRIPSLTNNQLNNISFNDLLSGVVCLPGAYVMDALFHEGIVKGTAGTLNPMVWANGLVALLCAVPHAGNLPKNPDHLFTGPKDKLLL